jgi:hypothetical protein
MRAITERRLIACYDGCRFPRPLLRCTGQPPRRGTRRLQAPELAVPPPEVTERASEGSISTTSSGGGEMPQRSRLKGSDTGSKPPETDHFEIRSGAGSKGSIPFLGTLGLRWYIRGCRLRTPSGTPYAARNLRRQRRRQVVERVQDAVAGRTPHDEREASLVRGAGYKEGGP